MFSFVFVEYCVENGLVKEGEVRGGDIRLGGGKLDEKEYILEVFQFIKMLECKGMGR